MEASTDRIRLVLTTAGSEAEADAIADALVERRLAACVSVIGPIKSVYRWQGDVVRDEERLLVIKSAERLFAELSAAIRELHSYDVPELLALPVTDGDERYLDWLVGCLKGSTTGG